MRKTLSEFYGLSSEDYKKLWLECIFVFDANVLLHLYQYSFNTTQDMLKIFTKIKDRLWLPYQIALEYQDNRMSYILNEEDKYNSIIEAIKKSPIKILKNINKNLEPHNNRYSNDDIRGQLTSLYENKVGEPYTTEQLINLYKIADERFAKLIPPGYKDKDKPLNKRHGDFIIWQDIINKSIEFQKPFIFITDDSKDDWWNNITKENKQTQNVGPRIELLKEFKDKTGMLFYMYSAEKFIEYSKTYLKTEVKQKTIDEVKELENKKSEYSILMNELIKRITQNEYNTALSAAILNYDNIAARVAAMPSNIAQILRGESIQTAIQSEADKLESNDEENDEKNNISINDKEKNK